MAGKKFIISGGGTGGHIFPAIAIANTLKKQLPDSENIIRRCECQNGNAEGT
jgi:UDP-N-acetylglucosamine:LPS N-acetylglucosamine transferase